MKIEWWESDDGWMDMHIDEVYTFCAYKVADRGRVIIYANRIVRGYASTIDEAKAMILALYALERD